MGLGFESFVALRYLKSRRKEVFISIITIISVIGVAISVMVLDMVLAIMTGFEGELVSKLVNANAQVVVRRYGADVEDAGKVTAQIKTVPGVTAAYPFVYRQAMLSAAGSAYGLLVRALPSDTEGHRKFAKMLDPSIKIEDLYRPHSLEITRPDGMVDTVELPPVVLGKELQNRLNLLPGQVVSLLSPQLGSSPMGLIPKLRRFIFIGTYHSGLTEYEAGIAYMSLKDAQEFFGMNQRVTGIEVEVAELFQAPAIARQIIQELGGAESIYYSTDWTQTNKAFMDAIALEKRVYFIVLLLLILVASFSIVSTLIMVVMEKNKDIAVMKTIGATNTAILRIFFMQGVVIGVTGTILGTALGYLGCVTLQRYGFPLDAGIFGLDVVPVYMEPKNFILVAISGLVITSLAGLYPARRAARLRPAEVLRYE